MLLPYKKSYAAAKSLQSCPTLCDPIDGSPPGSPSLGFSRQEHWSGLPFSSPMHEREKWKWSRSVISDPQWPHGLQPTRLLRLWGFPGKSTRVGCHCQPALRPVKHTLYTCFNRLKTEYVEKLKWTNCNSGIQIRAGWPLWIWFQIHSWIAENLNFLNCIRFKDITSCSQNSIC